MIDGKNFAANLQIVVFYHLVNRLPMSTCACDVHCSIVNHNVGDVFWEVGLNVAEEVCCFTGIVLASAS